MLVGSKMKPQEPTSDYALRVARGEIVTGKLVHLTCERHLRDLRTGKARGLYFDERAAGRAIRFFSFLRHSKGEWVNQLFELSDWQKFIIGCLFGWKRTDGTRRFRTALIEVARKNGKTTLMAGLGLLLFIGDREPGAEVYTAATKREQAKICWSEAKRMVRKSPDLAEMVKLYRDVMSLDDGAAKFEPLGADYNTLDGLNISGAIIDELHAHKSRETWDVVTTGTGSRRQPLVVAITTAGYDNETICAEQHNYAIQVLEDTIPDDDYFAYIACLDKGDDWTDEANWIKANPNLGISKKVEDLRSKCEKAKRIPAQQNNFLRRELNEWTQQAERWLDIAAWDATAGLLNEHELAGRDCYLGLDMGSKTDLTCVSLLFPMEDASYRLSVYPFMPEDTAHAREKDDRVPYTAWAKAGHITLTPGDAIDQDTIEAKIDELAGKYKILQAGYDSYNVDMLINHLMEKGLAMVPVPQTFLGMSAPTKYFEELILKKRLIHGGHPVLRNNALNVAVIQDSNENYRPAKSKSYGRIDCIVASINALARAMVNENSRSVYEERGVRSV